MAPATHSCLSPHHLGFGDFWKLREDSLSSFNHTTMARLLGLLEPLKCLGELDFELSVHYLNRLEGVTKQYLNKRECDIAQNMAKMEWFQLRSSEIPSNSQGLGNGPYW